MKKTTKRILAVLCLALVVMSLLALPVQAAGQYFPRYTGSSGSIVTGLKAVGADSSYAYRSRIAAANGITGYAGTAAQNTAMLNLLKQGKLKNPDAPAQTVQPAAGNCFGRYTGSSGSIVTGLQAVGADSSYAYRSQIAAANGITGYTGTAAQNTAMLNLLKQGKLVRPGASAQTPTSTTAQLQVNTGAKSFLDANGKGPIRAKAASTGKVLQRPAAGTCLPILGSTVNSAGNTWYITSYGGTTGYIFAGNIRSHSHSFRTLSYDGVTYNICDCGKVTVTTTQTVKLKRAEAMAGYLGMAGLTAVADGPIPLGDVIAAGMVILGAYEVMTMSTLSQTQAVNILRELDFEKYLKERENQCSNTSFRRVVREYGAVRYLDDRCLNLAEAYVYVRYMQGDVHTKYYATAVALGELHGGWYAEGKHESGYFDHVHLGKNPQSKVGGHVFYGCNAYGKWPG